MTTIVLLKLGPPSANKIISFKIEIMNNTGKQLLQEATSSFAPRNTYSHQDLSIPKKVGYFWAEELAVEVEYGLQGSEMTQHRPKTADVMSFVS